ncbi:MAG: hypothetical protein LUH08_04245 [Ruminococcus sp.]|nr:hypothetical protein [Ruminococcus sp.]
MKPYFIALALTFILSLSACQNDNTSVESSSSAQATQTTEATSEATTEATTEVQNVMQTPTFEYTEASDPDEKVTLKVTSDLENVDEFLVYHIEVTSDDKSVVYRRLAGEFPVNEISDNMTLDIDMSDAGEIEEISKDNSAIKTTFYSAGYKICAVNESDEQWSEYYPYEVLFDTGSVYQYNASFYGSTACGAANGVLLLQTAMPAWGDELNDRLDVVRSYSGISDDYSCGEEIDYCMSGTHIKNSVNRWLEENNISEFSVEDFGDEGGETEDIVRSLLDTGRPATVMVAYSGGELLDEYQYAHWITINGYRISDDGQTCEFRWENTILQVDSQWDSADTVATAIDVVINADNTGERYGIDEENMPEIVRYIIALKSPLVAALS